MLNIRTLKMKYIIKKIIWINFVRWNLSMTLLNCFS